MIEGTGREHPEVEDVARLIALVAGPDLLGDDFLKGETVDVGRCERQVLKTALLNLRPADRWQTRDLATADLDLDFAAAVVPVVSIGGIDTPGEAVNGFVIALVRDEN